MKKKIYATIMALLLSVTMLVGCGDSGSSRSSRDRYEDEDDDYDDDEKISGKSSSSKKKDYESDIKALTKVLKTLQRELNDSFYDIEGQSDAMNKAVKNLDVKTSEGKKIKSDLQEMADILKKAIKYSDDEDRLEDINDDLNDVFDDYMDHVYDFCDAAEDKGIDEEDLYDFVDIAEAAF